ncbi:MULTISPECIES: zinc ribbon domain-containing protein [Gracilibacillus]|uniref:zinc ribbon domain-containing protein n=1 Tax=Gracilibacillus TaxID=74385 RepID=UPI000824568D|nr:MULTISPECIES: zinc-ribbon domain-containing protein [Gracilibacillus]
MNNFCKECGHALKENAHFCPECGTPNTVQQPPPKKTTFIGTKRKQLSKKQKIVSISIAGVIILLFSAYQVGAFITDKDRLIGQFEEALIEKDSNAMSDLLSTSDDRMEINEDNTQRLIDRIEDNPSQQNYFVDALKQQGEAYDEGAASPMTNSVFSLEKKGKTALIYDNYQIEVTPFFFEVGTNMSDVQILLDGEELAISDSDTYSKEFGPLMPGTYHVTATYQNDYTILENQAELSLWEASYDQNQLLDLSLYGEYVSLYSEYADIADSTAFFVNDHEISMSEDEDFGPVSIDGSVEAYSTLSFPWGEAKSEVTPINSTYLDLAVPNPFSEEVRTEIINTIHSFGEEFAAAQRERDVSLYTNISSEYEEIAAEEFEYMNEYGNRWTGSYQKVIIDLDSFYLVKQDEQFILDVNTQFHYADVASYDEDDDDIETEDEITDLSVELIYDNENEAWLINDYSSIWAFEASNTEERTAEEQ